MDDANRKEEVDLWDDSFGLDNDVFMGYIPDGHGEDTKDSYGITQAGSDLEDSKGDAAASGAPAPPGSNDSSSAETPHHGAPFSESTTDISSDPKSSPESPRAPQPDNGVSITFLY